MTLSDYKQQDSLLGKQWNDALNSELKKQKELSSYYSILHQYQLHIGSEERQLKACEEKK